MTARFNLAGLALLLMVLPSIPAHGAETKMDIRGNITSVNVANQNNAGVIGSILIEGKVEKDTGFDKASIRITKETKLLQREGGKETSIKFEDLKVGQKAEASFNGPVAESYPVQTSAGLVVVLKDKPAK
jgi:beta-N-acetylhexosaminidase